MTPTVAQCVWLPAPRGGRILASPLFENAWGGPAGKHEERYDL